MRGDREPGPGRRPPRDPAKPLLAALDALGAGHATLLGHVERPWASITFSGTRHQLRYAFAGLAAIAAGEALIAALPEHEFAIPHQLVADATVNAVEHVLLPEPLLTIAIELLLLEDG